MKTKTLLTLLALAAIFTVQAESNRPNIILAMADDQGWGDMGYMGHNKIMAPGMAEVKLTDKVFEEEG